MRSTLGGSRYTAVVAHLALVVAVTGSAYAAATIKSGDIVDNQVKTKDVRDDTLKGGGLKGIDIREDTLDTVPNADMLDGIDSTGFLGATDTAHDSDKLDGMNSTDFLGAGDNASNSEKLDGHDITAWDAQRSIDVHGPLPKSDTFTTKGGTLFIAASGSAFRGEAKGAGRIGAEVLLDGTVIARIQTYTNELSSHKAFVPEFAVVEGIAAGEHTIEINAMYDADWCNQTGEIGSDYCTNTDGNDVFHVAVMEIPSS